MAQNAEKEKDDSAEHALEEQEHEMGSTEPETAAVAFSDDESAPDPRFLRATGRRYVALDENKEAAWDGEWSFAVLADTQFGLLNASFQMRQRTGEPRPENLSRIYSKAIGGDTISGTTWDEEREMAEEAVKHLNRLRPKFAIVCGDMVDAMPESGRLVDQDRDGSNDALHDLQVADFKAVFANLDPDIHLLCVCGNHDVGNIPNRKTIDSYRKDFGDDYYAFTCGGCRCIVLNTQLHNSLEEARWSDPLHRYIHTSDEDKEETQGLAHEQDEWLRVECEKLSAEPPEAHVMCFSHTPPFVRRPDEPKGYYNLEAGVRKPLLQKLKRAGCKKWFCGHYHQNAGGFDEGLEVVITSAAGTYIPLKPEVSEDSPEALGPPGQDFAMKECSSDVSGMRIVTVAREEIRHKWFTFDELNEAAMS